MTQESNDPVCEVCGELRSVHVSTDEGPLTHPREARGEGRYVKVRERYTRGMGPAEDDIEIPPEYKFEIGH